MIKLGQILLLHDQIARECDTIWPDLESLSEITLDWAAIFTSGVKTFEAHDWMDLIGEGVHTDTDGRSDIDVKVQCYGDQ